MYINSYFEILLFVVFCFIKLTDFYARFRLCQDIVLLKPEVAELLLPSAIVDLAARKDIDVNLHRLISLKVIFQLTLL